MNWEIVKGVFGIVLLTIFIGGTLACFNEIVREKNGELSDKDWECINHPNFISNSTHGIVHSFGKCYYEIPHFYQTREVCRGGFLGVGQSCYESDNAYTESFSTTECFVLKTGERC